MTTDSRENASSMPATIGRYEIVARLATGGMAEILLGRLVGPNGFERPVVIKRILPHLARVPTFLDMFLDEARIVADIRHPNVVQVHELGRADEELFLVMEYLEGESASALLKRMVSRSENLPFGVAAYIVAELCAGLHAAHELVDTNGKPRELVHRDVSSQNVFVTYAGSVKLLDFGIAQAADRITRTEAGQIKGKFEYMSPEQCLSKPLDRRADIFAAGVVLYELSTGTRLFRRDSPAATIQAIFSPFTPPSLARTAYPPSLERVVLKALAQKRKDRYATAAEMRKDLLASLRAMSTEDEPTEALGKLMRERFAERMGDKAEMLRKLRLGGIDVHVPMHETDSAIDLPAPPSIDATAVGSEVAPRPSSVPNARPRRVWPMIAVAFVGIGGALLYHQRAATTERASAPAISSVSSATAETSTAPPLPSIIATTAAPATSIVVHVDATPRGSHVFLGDVDQGAAPIDLHLPSSKSPIAMDVRHPGFTAQNQQLVPDVNQRIGVALEKEDRRGASAAPHPATKTAVSPPAATAPTTPPPPMPTDGFTKFN